MLNATAADLLLSPICVVPSKLFLCAGLWAIGFNSPE